MGCSRRTRYQDIKPEQKWDFISLNDFKSTSCLAPLAYGYLWASLVVSVAVYGVDTFTAVQLLAFNNWSSQVTPAVSRDVSKWIFSMCIIASWVNLGYEYWRALRVMKRGAVAESYLDSLAVRLQCIRMGTEGRGWRRFLVFAELTKSKKGAEYVALFTYFSFQAWIRIIFCSGPRQVVNAVTLLAVYRANLDPDAADADASILQFFKNIGILAEERKEQAVILSGMLFTLVIWVFAALSLLLAVLFYVLFLWHYIPNSDGGLSGYCERKINSRLTKIVSAKVNKALEDEERKKLRDARKAAKKGEAVVLGRQATLPTLFDPTDDNKLPQMPMLHRNDTMATLPLYSSRPGTPSSQQPTVPSFELNDMEKKRPYPSRTETLSSAMSNTSYASNVPLVGAAGEMGYGRSGSPTPSLPPLDTNGFPFPQRSMTASSNGSQWQNEAPHSTRGGPMGPPLRQPTQDSYRSGPRGPPSRQMSQDPYSPAPTGPASRSLASEGFVASPSTYDEYGRGSPRPQVSSPDTYGRPLPRGVDERGGRSTPGGPMAGRRTPFAENYQGGRSSPAPNMQQVGRPGPAPGSQLDSGTRAPLSGGAGPNGGWQQPPNDDDLRSPNGSSSGGYVPYNPTMRSASAGIPGPASTFQPQQQRPTRNMTEPGPGPSRRPTGDYPGSMQPSRQGTPQSQRAGYNDQYGAYSGPGSQPSRTGTSQSQRGGYNDQFNAMPGSGDQSRGGNPNNYSRRPERPPQQGGYRG